jgi:predicted RNase H-like HicB family nuclease
MRMNTSELRYTVLMMKNEDGGFTVTVPSLPGCITEGDTWEEALKNIEEAIQGFLEALAITNNPIPVEVNVQMKGPAWV